MKEYKYFVSYMFTGKNGGHGFGNCVAIRSEPWDSHAATTVQNDLNKEQNYKSMTILFFQELPK